MKGSWPRPSWPPPPAAEGPWVREPVEQLVAETEGGGGLKRTVGALDLTALGVGAIIGTGLVGLAVYAAYGRTHSRLQRGEGPRAV